jgi:hypothetical protein
VRGAIALCLLLAPLPATAQSSAPGRALLAAAETAQLAVVGRITAPSAVDRTAHVAGLAVERTAAGVPPAAPRITWEQLGGGPARFADGQRVLVALEPIPSGSLWQRRFPSRDVLAVGARGDAFLLDPSDGDVDALTAYLQLGSGTVPQVRGAALVRLAGADSSLLATAAVERLGARDTQLDRDSGMKLLTIAADQHRPHSLRSAILARLGASGLPSMAPEIEPLARPGSSVEAEALEAIGTLNGGLAADRVEALLDRDEPAVRAVGARCATGALAARRLPSMTRADSAPTVRAAAARALAATRTVWGIDGAVPALADPDGQVRAAAAQALAALGSLGVPTLEAVAASNRPEARGAITALALAGPDGQASVRRLATQHRDERLRDYARLALGQGPHSH